MNMLLIASLMWTIFGVSQVPLVKEFFNPTVFPTLCIPEMLVEKHGECGHHVRFSKCDYMAVFCSEQDKNAVALAPEMFEWMLMYKEWKQEFDRRHNQDEFLMMSLQAKQMLHSVRLAIMRAAVAVALDKDHSLTVVERVHYLAECKARKDREKASKEHKKKNGYHRQNVRKVYKK